MCNVYCNANTHAAYISRLEYVSFQNIYNRGSSFPVEVEIMSLPQLLLYFSDAAFKTHLIPACVLALFQAEKPRGNGDGVRLAKTNLEATQCAILPTTTRCWL